MHYSAEGKTNEGKGEDERTKGMDGRGRRKGGKLKFQSSVFSTNTLPLPSPPPPLLPSPSRVGFTFVHDARSRVIFKRNEWPLHLLRGYISRTRRHCNFPPRHRHRYHELVIDAFHYSRGDDSTETATYRSSGRVNFSSTRDFLLFYIPRRGSFPEGKTKIRVDRIGYGGGGGEGGGVKGGEKKRKIEGNETWCRNTRYNLWRMWDGMKINKVR